MDSETPSIEAVRKQIARKETELEELRTLLAKLEAQTTIEKEFEATESKWPLCPDEYQRYGRQLIVPGVGIQGQLRLKSASVLIVGAGGLGCPAAAYLAAAGVGTLGLVDVDIVESSNFHRQILHNERTKGMKKVDSAIKYLNLNPHPRYNAYPMHLTPQNAEEITTKYDLVLDCTDNPASRYLISDICCLLQKPLISASALRFEGQLTLLNWPPLPAGNENGGPCYRCLFPKPPPSDTVLSCGEGGIVGPVVGVIGVLQALNAVKLVIEGKLENIYDRKQNEPSPRMLLFSANSSPQFRSVRLKGRRKDCSACSAGATLSLRNLFNGEINYPLFCGMSGSSRALISEQDHIEITKYARRREEDKNHILIDVREKVEFDICNLPGSVNLPFSKLQNKLSPFSMETGGLNSWLESLPQADMYVICRLGNNSQIVTKQIKDTGTKVVKNIRGGFKAWRNLVDPSWPKY